MVDFAQNCTVKKYAQNGCFDIKKFWKNRRDFVAKFWQKFVEISGKIRGKIRVILSAKLGCFRGKKRVFFALVLIAKLHKITLGKSAEFWCVLWLFFAKNTTRVRDFCKFWHIEWHRYKNERLPLLVMQANFDGKKSVQKLIILSQKY